MTQYDAIIIGTGQAGPPLAKRLAKAGMKVAIVERKLFGGTCVNTGCIPTKALVASARTAAVTRRSREYGVTVDGQIRIDMQAVKARKDKISGDSRSGVEKSLKSTQNCTVYEGHAHFVSPREIEINGERIGAPQIFINVGARAIVPDMPGLDRVSYMTNSSMLDVDFVPEHLVIVGGSYVGLEFAQMYRRFGSEVTVIEKGSRLIAREDEDVSAAVAEILEHEGIHLRLNAECIRFERDGVESIARVDCAQGSPDVRGSHILLAVGRRPNTDDLDFEKAGIATDKNGNIIVDDQLQTNIPGIWALGDCNGRGGFTHTSYNDFEIVAANLLDRGSRRVTDRITAYALYIDPPLGRAGMTAAEAVQAGKHVLIGKRPMTRIGRAIEKGETQGFMKILVDADTERILGAAILGTGGDEVIHCILDVMYANAPYTLLQQAMHIHPTVSELVPTVLGELEPLPASESSKAAQRG